MKGQRSFHPDVSLYVVHAIEDNVSSRHVKNKTCPYASIAIHNFQSRRKYLYTIRGLGLHASALDAEFTLFKDDVFLSDVRNLREENIALDAEFTLFKDDVFLSEIADI